MKHVIFDFDGTLVDSLPVAMAIAKEMVPGLSFSDEELERLRELPAKQVIKQSGIPYWKLLRLLIRGKKIMSLRLDDLKAFPGIDDMIKELHKQDFHLSVVSSNSEENIRKVLRREGVEAYFSGVYGNVGLFSKARVFKAVLKDQKAAVAECIYVGDEVRDIESAHKAGLRVISVTWGYNGKKILSSYKPEFLADTPKQLQEIISKQVHAK